MDGAGPAGIIMATFAVARAATDVQSPQLDTGAWIQIIALIVSLILAAAASAAETAFTSINRITLKNLVEEGDEEPKKIEQLIAQPNVFLSTILVLNTVPSFFPSHM